MMNFLKGLFSINDAPTQVFRGLCLAILAYALTPEGAALLATLGPWGQAVVGILALVTGGVAATTKTSA